MRLLRQRRREGAIVVDVEVFAIERAHMVRQGLIRPDQHLDREAVAGVGRRCIRITCDRPSTDETHDGRRQERDDAGL
jgi:hypothetical protein